MEQTQKPTRKHAPGGSNAYAQRARRQRLKLAAKALGFATIDEMVTAILALSPTRQEEVAATIRKV